MYMKMIKETSKLIIGAGVSLAVTSLLKENIETPNSFRKKASLAIGVFMLARYVSGKVTDDYSNKFDRFEENFDKLVSRIKSIKPEKKEA